MEIKNGKCLMGNKVYSNGEQVCDSSKCYVCESGEWNSRYIDLVHGIGP